MLEQDAYTQQIERETLRSHRIWYALAVCLMIIGLAANRFVAFGAGLVVLGLSALPELWFRRGLRDLEVEQTLSARRAFVGDTITLDVRVANQKRLPLPWVEVRSDIPAPLEMRGERIEHAAAAKRATLVNRFALWSWRAGAKRQEMYCAQRGYYWLGPATVRVSDPLGWLQTEARTPAPQLFVQVYPLIMALADFKLPAYAPFGDLPTPRRLLEDPMRTAGVRPYQPGDDPRLIHWKASARAGALLRKVLDPSGQHRLFVVLDVNTYHQRGWWIDPILMELTISVAASIALWGLDNGYATGFLANSPIITDFSEATTAADAAATGQKRTEALWLPPTTHRFQRERVLSGLARILAFSGANIHDVIELYRREIPSGSTVIVVASKFSLRPESIEYLLQLRNHGVGAHLVLTGETDSPPSTDTGDLPIHAIGGKEVWRDLIAAARKHAE